MNMCRAYSSSIQISGLGDQQLIQFLVFGAQKPHDVGYSDPSRLAHVGMRFEGFGVEVLGRAAWTPNLLGVRREYGNTLCGDYIPSIPSNNQ